MRETLNKYKIFDIMSMYPLNMIWPLSEHHYGQYKGGQAIGPGYRYNTKSYAYVRVHEKLIETVLFDTEAYYTL